MIIDTKELIKNTDLKFIEKKRSIEKIMNVKEKILNFLKNKNKTAKQLEKELNLDGRTVRLELLRLEKEKLVKKAKGKKISNKGISPNYWTTKGDRKILNIVPEERICLFYETKHRGKARKNHYYIFPDRIDLDENKLAAVGIFEAEGSKTKNKTTEIVNCEPMLITIFINFLEYFGIEKNELHFRIIFNKKLLREKYGINKNYLENEAEKFWRAKINIPKETKIKFHYAGSLIGSLRKNPAIRGSLNLEYHNALFRKFLEVLIKRIKTELNNKENIIPYLRGFLSGEAYVGNHDREIQVASIRIEELELLKKLLAKLNMPCSISKQTSTSPPRVLIARVKSFLYLDFYDVFKFHPEKRKALIEKILNYKTLNEKVRLKLENKLKTLI